MRSAFHALRTILAAIGGLYLFVTFTPVTAWWARQLAGKWEDPKGDILIVLGANRPTTDGLLGDSSYWRAVYAVRAWREGGFRMVVLSGGLGTAASMRDFLLFEGVPSEAITIDERSVSTRENALFVDRMLQGSTGKRVLMTSDYHMYRALRVFRKAGTVVEPRPIPDVLKRSGQLHNRWTAFIDLCIETAKIVGYAVKGWT